MVRRRLSLPFTDVKEDDEVVTDEEINNWKWKSYHEIDVEQMKAHPLPAIEEQHPFNQCIQRWLHIQVVLWL